VEFDGTTWARRVGEEGRGIETVTGTIAATRLDCVTWSAARMRQAVAQAVHHCAYRGAFGGLLVDKPLMRNVLADLALESEAATALALRLAAAYDAAFPVSGGACGPGEPGTGTGEPGAPGAGNGKNGAGNGKPSHAGDEGERCLLQLALPAAKYWVARRCTPVAAEALECLGGDGYIEDSRMPRLLRESPLGSLWGGSGNVQALGVLRALRREPAALDAFLTEIGAARGADHRLDGAIGNLLAELADLERIEARARRLAERMALVLQGSLLVRFAPPEVADAFCAGRLGPDTGAAFGTLPHTLDLASVVDRAQVPVRDVHEAGAARAPG
jgi:putative acyl-CoA dehydrogenase